MIEVFIEFIGSLGYIGLFLSALLMFMIFPLPAQPILMAAGVLIARDEMGFYFALIAATAGALAGALINYTVAIRFGREFLLTRLSLFIEAKHLDRMEWFFAKYGSKSLFIGLILPSIGQMITLPAGLAKMPFKSFVLITLIGSMIWCGYMLGLGLFFGQYMDVIQERLTLVGSIILGVVLFLGVSFYILRREVLKYYRLIRWRDANRPD